MVKFRGSAEESSGLLEYPWGTPSNARDIDDDAEDHEDDELVELASDEGSGEGSDEGREEAAGGACLREALPFSSGESSNELPAHHGQVLNEGQDTTDLYHFGLSRHQQPEYDRLRVFDGFSPEQGAQRSIILSSLTESSGHGRSQSTRDDQATSFPRFGIDDLSPLYSQFLSGGDALSLYDFERWSSGSSPPLDFSAFNGSRANAPNRLSIPYQRNRSNFHGHFSSVSDSPIYVSSTGRLPQNRRQSSDAGLSATTEYPPNPDQARRHRLSLNSNYNTGEWIGESNYSRFNHFLGQGTVPQPWHMPLRPPSVPSTDRRRGVSLGGATQSTDRLLRKKLNSGATKSRKLSSHLARLLSIYCQSRNRADGLSLGPPIPDLPVRNPHGGSLPFVYTITLIPASFSLEKVIEIIDIFQRRAPYIPALVTMDPGEHPQQHYGHFDTRWLADTSNENSSHHVDAPRGRDGQGWPMGEVPTEIFQRIAEELSWEDLLSMRRVNHEFERKVSGFIFKAVVVPFRRQIYSAKAHDEIVHTKDLKGKGKVTYDPVDDQHLHMVKHGYYSNVKDKDIYNGMEVFNAWGSHIRKFAMSFEVNEDVLRHPPNKGRFETHNSFWGSFIWPSPQYTRYSACENLEKKADEHQLMTTALSNLGSVFELALSVVSGLGWITGPDQSDRQKIFYKKPEVFGSRFPPSISESRSRHRRWKALTGHVYFRDAHTRGPGDVDDLGLLHSRKYPPLIFDGVDHEFAVPDNYDIGSSHALTSSNLIPNSLTAAQQEWLLENNWAQEAFLTSWCMALVDNACTFKHVHTLKFARLSSRYLKMLERQDIWTALENLRNVTILLVPDWRDVVKTDDRIVDTPTILPSLAADQFFSFLEQWLVGAEKLTGLKVGYAAGGERARGMYACNKHVLPAPVVKFNQPHRAVDLVDKVLTLPYIQHLTLSNCWIPPDMLKQFVSVHSMENSLQTLVLDSVSLTAWSGAKRSDPVVPHRPVGIPFAAALNRAAIANPMLRNLSPVVQLQMIQDLQLSSNGQNFDLGPDVPHDWLDYKEGKGSWPDVINAITPGETLDQKRFLFGHVEDAPLSRPPGSLRRIEFISCGYVRLPKLRTLDQQAVGKVESTYISCLRQRSNELAHVMMSTEDNFLGQIVPTIDLDEYMLLTSAFGMTSGWGDDDSKYENREDGQLEGGSGRFNGSLLGVEDDGRES
ncbi:hypothetical protein MMC22_009539 [Lobaria immixta]|nr:hypothetical protein [Lobaria immixta]